MAEPGNRTLRLLRDIREQNKAARSDVSGMRSEMREKIRKHQRAPQISSKP